MSEAIIVVERLTKQVRDSTGTLTILHEIDFSLTIVPARDRSSRHRGCPPGVWVVADLGVVVRGRAYVI